MSTNAKASRFRPGLVGGASAPVPMTESVGVLERNEEFLLVQATVTTPTPAATRNRRRLSIRSASEGTRNLLAQLVRRQRPGGHEHASARAVIDDRHRLSDEAEAVPDGRRRIEDAGKGPVEA